MRYVIGILLVFGLGLAVGWYLRDDTARPVVLAGDVAEAPTVGALYAANDLAGVIAMSGGDADVIAGVIRGDDRSGRDRSGRDRSGRDRSGRDRSGHDRSRHDRPDSAIALIEAFSSAEAV
jgi:hypothetical protein